MAAAAAAAVALLFNQLDLTRFGKRRNHKGKLSLLGSMLQTLVNL